MSCRVVPDPPFDATNAPQDFTGQGRLERRSAVTAPYVDGAGALIRFEANEDWERPVCD